MKKILLPLLIFCLALTACGGKTVPAPVANGKIATPSPRPSSTTSPSPTLSPTPQNSKTPQKTPSLTPPPNLLPAGYSVRINGTNYALGYTSANSGVYMPKTNVPALWQGSPLEIQVRHGAGNQEHVDITGFEGPAGTSKIDNYNQVPGYDIVLSKINTPYGVQTVIKLTIMVNGRPVTVQVPLISKGFMPTPQPSGGGNNGGGNGIPNPHGTPTTIH